MDRSKLIKQILERIETTVKETTDEEDMRWSRKYRESLQNTIIEKEETITGVIKEASLREHDIYSAVKKITKKACSFAKEEKREMVITADLEKAKESLKCTIWPFC